MIPQLNTADCDPITAAQMALPKAPFPECVNPTTPYWIRRRAMWWALEAQRGHDSAENSWRYAGFLFCKAAIIEASRP